MVEPNIIFCSFNHIYDAALHEECPYCKKIREDQEALNRSLGGDMIELGKLSNEKQEDATELLKRQHVIQDSILENNSIELITQEDGDESTELISREKTDEDVTELVIRTHSDDSFYSKNNKSYKPVLGWLVCNSGDQVGRSFEVVEGKNYILASERKVNVFYDFSPKNIFSAELFVDILNDEFYISVIADNEMSINGNIITDSVIRNYDILKINSMEFVFVELMTEFVSWGI